MDGPASPDSSQTSPAAALAHVDLVNGFKFFNGRPVPYFTTMRDRRNKMSPAWRDVAAVTSNKLAFNLLAKGIGVNSPNIRAHTAAGFAISPEERRPQKLDTFLSSLPDGEYFCKPVFGQNGKLTFPLSIRAGSMFVRQAAESAQSIAQKLGGGRYLIQDSLTAAQHPTLAQYSASSINTVRMVTFKNKATISPAAVLIRLGANGLHIDAWHAGGLIVGVDPSTGTFQPYGVRKDLRLFSNHPIGNIAFEGQRVPFYHQALEMVTKLHLLLPIPTLGWDIALTTAGPFILESNVFWDTIMPGVVDPSFIERMMDFHGVSPDLARVHRLRVTGAFENKLQIRRWLAPAFAAALSSGRIESASKGELIVLAAGGGVDNLNKLTRFLQEPAEGIKVSGIAVEDSTESLTRGFDVRAALTGAPAPKIIAN